MTTIEEIKEAINLWSKERTDGDKAKSLLEKGSFFKISRLDFEKWGELKVKPELIYAYGGDFKDVFKFVLIDSESAQKPLDDKTLPYTFVKDFVKDFDVNSPDFLMDIKAGNIEVNDALKRVMRWDIMMDSWIGEQTSTTPDVKGVTKVFKIPFESLKNAFENSNVDEVLAVIGLKPSLDNSDYDTDLILWSTSSIKGTGDLKVENLVKPCPPYCDLPTWP